LPTLFNGVDDCRESRAQAARGIAKAESTGPRAMGIIASVYR
jgi:hypothetical protein